MLFLIEWIKERKTLPRTCYDRCSACYGLFHILELTIGDRLLCIACRDLLYPPISFDGLGATTGEIIYPALMPNRNHMLRLKGNGSGQVY